MTTNEIAVLGVGMHKWGKFPGKSFVDIGVEAARDALDDSGVEWAEIQFLSGANTVRNGYPGWVSASTFANALGFQGCQVASSYAACASGVTALSIARSQILAGICEVALVVGADQVAKGMFAPVPGDRPNDVDWLRFRLMGLSNPAYFGMFARRRMALYGDTQDDFAAVKVKNSEHGSSNPNARYAKVFTIDDVNASPVVADPLRLLEICSTSDGGAALVVSSLDFARKKGIKDPVKIAGISTVSPTYPNAIIDMPYFASDSWYSVGDRHHTFKDQIAQHAYKEAGITPSELDFAEVYDLSSAYELDWYEHIGLCGPGEARNLLHNGDTRIGGKVPINPSGGLGAFGEAIPAQAIAQVCELTWQLRGQATGRQVDNAQIGMSINYGMFGHGSSVIARI